MVDSCQAQCALAALVGRITKVVVIHALDCSLIISGARNSSRLHAWLWSSGRNARARWEIDLCWCCAVQAALLAPSKEASSLAVLEAVVCSDRVALRAIRADANGSSQAFVELVMVDSCQAQRTLAALVGRITEVVVIHALDCSLIISGARNSSRLHAWLWGSSRNARARWKINLCWCCAVQAALLAPSK